MRGLFLRGTGGNAATLGQMQQDAGRNATGTFISVDDNLIFSEYVTGVFSVSTESVGLDDGGSDNVLISFDLSRAWGTAHIANEFRPLNRSVRFLIRAFL
jgi:hypothetical protein